MKKILTLLFLMVASPVMATTYWTSTTAVSTTMADCDGTADPLTYCTTASILSNLVAGDIIKFKAGTYDTSFVNPLPSGTSASARTRMTCEGNLTCIIEPTTTPSGGNVIFLSAARNYIEIDNFKISHANQTGTINAGIRTSDGLTFTGLYIHDNEVDGTGKTMGSTYAAFTIANGVNNSTYSYNHVHDIDSGDGSPGAHGFYVRGDNNVIEYNEISGHDGLCYQFYSGSDVVDGNIGRYNYCHDAASPSAGGGIWTGYSSGSDNRSYGNIIHNVTTGIYVRGTNTKVYNNSVYAVTTGMDVAAGTGCQIKNNLLPSESMGTADADCTYSKNIATNGDVSTGSVPGDIWVNAGSGNFSLIAASPAIDVGTASIATGVTACSNGSLPDIGAIESLPQPTATVDGTAAVITVSNNCTSQMLPASSVTGWTFKLNGAGNTVTANSLSGTNSYAATLTNAFVGGDTCVFSYAQTGNSTSNNDIGNLTTSNQEVLAFTDASCTNITSGTGSVALSHWRVYTLQGAADTSWIAVSGCAADFTNCTVAPGSRLWVRAKLRNNSGSNVGAFNLSHRWRYNGGSYVTLTGSYVNGLMVVGTGSQPGTVLSDGTATTQDQLTSNESTNVACLASRSTGSIPSLTLVDASESECAQGIDISTSATPGDTYEYCPHKDDGTALTCATPIKLTVGSYGGVR